MVRSRGTVANSAAVCVAHCRMSGGNVRCGDTTWVTGQSVCKGVLLLQTAVREGLAGKGTFGLRPKGRDKVSSVEFRGNLSLGPGNCTLEGPGQQRAGLYGD